MSKTITGCLAVKKWNLNSVEVEASSPKVRRRRWTGDWSRVWKGHADTSCKQPPSLRLFHTPCLVLWPSWGHTRRGGGVAQVSFHDDTVSTRPIGNLSWHLRGQRAAGRRASYRYIWHGGSGGEKVQTVCEGKATNAWKSPGFYIFVFQN